MSKFIGDVSAYAYAVSKGYTGTEEEFAELMASYADVGQTAVDAKDAAVAAKTAAQTAATTATAKASEATTAATTATTKAGEASTSASTATSAKDTAVSASQTATTKATEATTAAATAVSAKDDAVSANTAAQSAKTAAQTAQTGAETAAASVQSSAAQIQTNADDISKLKEDLTDKADAVDLLKAFPTDTASGSVASFADGANVPVKSLIVNIDPVQSGSGDPSPDNVRPISGHTQAVVTRTGVNVWDEEWELGYIVPNTGALNNRTDRIRSKKYIPVLGGIGYYFHTLGMAMNCVWYDASLNYIRNSSPNNEIIISPQNARYCKFSMPSDYGATYNHDISINYPSTDHDYHPYSGQSITIALGQTVYGGTVDVTTGTMTVTDAVVDLGSLTWVFRDVYGGFFHSGGLTDSVADSSVCICSSYRNAWGGSEFIQNNDCVVFINANDNGGAITGGATYKHIILIDRRFTDAASLKAALSGVMLCYKLATPLTIQLTPAQLSTLKGTNNVWSDADSISVEYVADPTLYISRLTEPDADMVADANITSGQYFMVGNTLYKATANIASGGAITPNVNCTRKSLSEALNELNA